MSTKRLAEALFLLDRHIDACGPCDHDVNICVCGDNHVLTEARMELAAIREAAKTLARLHIGDYVYNVRDHRQGDWHHHDVKAWSDASVLMGAIAKEE